MSLFGCDSIIGRACNECPENEPNKIVHAALVRKGTTVTLTNPATIIANILAAEAACNAYVVRNISGAYDGGTLTEGKGPGKSTTRVTGGEHVLTFTDFDYLPNAAFWNTVKYAGRNYDLYYFTSNYVWVVRNTGLSINPKPAVTDDIKTNIEAEISIKWSSGDNPLPYAANVDDVEACVPLFETSGKHFTAGSSDASVIVVGTDTVNDSVSATTSQAIHIIYNAAVAFSSYEVTSDNLPAGLTLSKSGNTIKIDGTATSTGTTDVTIRLANDCGVSADFGVTFIIT
jgi:hypothetical protein